MLTALAVDLTLKEKFAVLKDIESSCSLAIQKGIELFIKSKEETFEKINDLLKNGYGLYSVRSQKKNDPLTPEIIISLESLKESSNNKFIILKIGEVKKEGIVGYGEISKNSNGEIVDVYVNKKALNIKTSQERNPLFVQNVEVKHNFEKFDIINIPFVCPYAVIVDENEVKESQCELLGDSPFKCKINFARLGTGWDYGKDYYFGQLEVLPELASMMEKVDFEDAPYKISLLVDRLRKDLSESK